MTPAPSQKLNRVPTKSDDIGAIPLEGSGFEDQQPDHQENEGEEENG
jgi:hypothetical protein